MVLRCRFTYGNLANLADEELLLCVNHIVS
jgi:hypothetical protein